MKTIEVIKISIITVILIFAFSATYYFAIFLPKTNTASSTDIIGNTLKCEELYELKKIKYWGEEIGQDKAIYNENLNTCLALNVYDDFQTKKFFAMIIDMSDDSTLMYYNSTPQGIYFENNEKIICEDNYVYFEFTQDGKLIKEYGCDSDEEGRLTDKFELLDKMFEKIRDFDFKIFDGFYLK